MTGKGYIPHAGALYLKCPSCGNDTFRSFPQTAPADRSAAWTWEFICSKCGRLVCLKLDGDH